MNCRARLVMPFAGLAAAAACQLVPSHTPLGGDYALPDSEVARHEVNGRPIPPATDEPVESEEEADHKAVVSSPPASLDARPAEPSVALVRYDPLRAGDQITAEVTLSLSAEMRGGPPGLFGSDKKLVLDGHMHVELKVLKASLQSLDELELTLTPTSLHLEFGGTTHTEKHEPSSTYDVTLSGNSPNIRAQSGGTLDPEERAALIVLVTPLVQFHSHWAQAPSLPLKPGWSASVPIAAPAFMAGAGDSVKIGPFGARYSGPGVANSAVPFELELPVEYSTDDGRLRIDFTGKAELDSIKGRPVSLDLSGPLSGSGGPSGPQIDFQGAAKFAATLSYR